MRPNFTSRTRTRVSRSAVLTELRAWPLIVARDFARRAARIAARTATLVACCCAATGNAIPTSITTTVETVRRRDGEIMLPSFGAISAPYGRHQEHGAVT